MKCIQCICSQVLDEALHADRINEDGLIDSEQLQWSQDKRNLRGVGRDEALRERLHPAGVMPSRDGTAGTFECCIPSHKSRPCKSLFSW
jgi:hypothetical protein